MKDKDMLVGWDDGKIYLYLKGDQKTAPIAGVIWARRKEWHDMHYVYITPWMSDIRNSAHNRLAAITMEV